MVNRCYVGKILSWKSAFWAVTFLLHGSAFLWQLQDPWILTDSREYLQTADNLLQEGTLYTGDLRDPIRMDNYTKRPPIYPLFLIFSGANQVGYGVTWLIQCVLSFVSIWWISRLVQRRMKQEIPWGIWMICLVLTPSQWIYPQLIMTEILFQIMLLSLGVAMWRSWEGDRWAYAIGSLIVVLAFLTKPVWYLFVLPWLGWGLLLTWRHRSLRYVAFALVPILMLGGYLSWNKARTGYWHMSSIQNLSLLQYTTTHLLTQVHGPELGVVKADSILSLSLAQPCYREEQLVLQQACAATIQQHPREYAWLHLRGMAHFFLDPGRFDFWEFFRLPAMESGWLNTFQREGYRGLWASAQRLPIFWVGLLIGVLIVNVTKLAALGWFCWRHRRHVITWILLLLFGYLSTLTGTSGASRFALPLFPWMLFCVAFLPFGRRPSASPNKNTVSPIPSEDPHSQTSS